VHLQEKGENVEAVKKFERSGGTHLILVHLPYHDLRKWDINGYEPAYKRTLSLAERVRKETSIEVHVALGPYPVDLINLVKKVSLEEAEKIMQKGMELAADYVEKGEAVAIGEIGRPHFEVSEEILEVSNRIMQYGMEIAAEIDCPVILHTESTNPSICEEIGHMADDAGISREKVIKHYAPPLVLIEENHGLFPSILASEKNIREALQKSTRFMMETDFLDDPNRPGAVLGIKTVAKRTKKFEEKGLLDDESIWKIHKEYPEKIYDIEVEL